MRIPFTSLKDRSGITITKTLYPRYIVAGIHTGAGKSFISGVLCRGLGYHYWKPVQTGATELTDSAWMEEVAGIPPSHIIKEAYRFSLPASPHLAAEAENTRIDPELIRLPEVQGGLIIELAGGLMVPLDANTLMIDLLVKWDLPVLLVVPLYLGSINHALLSIEALEHRNIPLAGIIFNEGDQTSGAGAIAARTSAPVLGQLPLLPATTEAIGSAFSKYLHQGWITAGLPCDGPGAS